MEANDVSRKIVKGHETILVVDNNEDLILDVATQMLEKMGYQVSIAKSGEEAVETYRKSKDQIDMVIHDMFRSELPRLQGGASRKISAASESSPHHDDTQCTSE